MTGPRSKRRSKGIGVPAFFSFGLHGAVRNGRFLSRKFHKAAVRQIECKTGIASLTIQIRISLMEILP